MPSRRRIARIAWIAAATLACSSLQGCNALRKTTECKVDLDCPRGSMCSIDEGYCRTGGPIVIGFLGAKTGTQGTTTTQRRQAIDFGRWVIERDPSLKILGRGVVVRDERDLGDATLAAAAANRLISANVAAIIGPESSNETIPAQQVTFPRELLELAPSSAAPTVGTAQPNDPHQRFLFQMVTGVPGFIPTLPLFLSPPNRPASFDVCLDGMAVVADDSAIGKGLQDAIDDPNGVLPKYCIPVTATLSIPALGKADYGSVIDALMAAAGKTGKPTQCLFLATDVGPAGDILRALAVREAANPSRSPYNAFIGAGTLNDPTFPDAAKSPIAGQPSLAEGFYGIDADGNPVRVQLRDLQTLFAQYLPTQSVLPPGTVLDTNLAPYAEAIIILQLAIELAGTVDDPVALRNALLEVTGPDEGDQTYGPASVTDAITAIRAARQDGRRAKIDYQASYSNLDFQPGGYVGTGTMVWRVDDKDMVKQDVIPFKEEQIAAAAAAPQKNCSATTK
jgi:hypothetical protein